MSAPVPRVALAPGYTIACVINGCWQLTPDHGGGPRSQAEALGRFAELVDQGFTTFDGADIYVGVEATLGAFRRSLADPERIQIHTKYVPDRAALATLRPADVDAAIDRSRRRLAMDQLDLVQFHWWRYDVPGLAMVVERLREAQARGWIRLLGCTNFDTAHVRELLDQAVPIVSLQAQYSLLDRRPERAMTALCAERGVRLLAYGALAGGYLTAARLGADDDTPANRSLTKYRLIIEEAGGWARYQSLLRLLGRIGEKHGVGPEAVAVRWLLDQPAVAGVILGVGRRSRVDSHRALLGLRLDDDDRAGLADFLARQPVPPGDMYDLERDPAGRHAGIIKTDLNAVDAGHAP